MAAHALVDRTAGRLIALGAALFFLGLLTGLVVPAMTNPRMGVAGHLEGVMNGIFLIAIGAVPAVGDMDVLTDRIGAIDGVTRTTTSVVLARRIDRTA